MSWWPILALAAVSYALKAAGSLLIGSRPIPEAQRSLIGLASVPLLAALIAVQTISTEHDLVADARLPALGVAAVLVWRRAPFLVVVLAAAATAALLRQL